MWLKGMWLVLEGRFPNVIFLDKRTMMIITLSLFSSSWSWSFLLNFLNRCFKARFWYSWFLHWRWLRRLKSLFSWWAICHFDECPVLIMFHFLKFSRKRFLMLLEKTLSKFSYHRFFLSRWWLGSVTSNWISFGLYDMIFFVHRWLNQWSLAWLTKKSLTLFWCTEACCIYS